MTHRIACGLPTGPSIRSHVQRHSRIQEKVVEHKNFTGSAQKHKLGGLWPKDRFAALTKPSTTKNRRKERLTSLIWEQRERIHVVFQLAPVIAFPAEDGNERCSVSSELTSM